uniref:Type I restriction modification DNA specificity domain-containing protein n=1 Tax=Thermus caliditerrae TaxID=1330700 RepID=A0A7C5VIT3_9DEIN
MPPRFKRHYVAPEIGVPFIRPSDLATVRVLEPRYIARWTPELDSARLQLGEVVISRSGSIGEVGLITQAWDGWAGSDDLARVAAKEGLSDPGYLYIFLTSPYGQIQIQRQIYGGVIDHLEVEHLAQIRVPRAPLDVQQEIGDLVWKAFALRDEANALEEAAVRQLEEVIRKGPGPHLVLGQAE